MTHPHTTLHPPKTCPPPNARTGSTKARTPACSNADALAGSKAGTAAGSNSGAAAGRHSAPLVAR
jgi:hypothetical protein